MAKTKTVQMPAGIRNKLMASIAMLLVSSIMMVSTTYAWFTLSTAPEVTGITTSVGANGNLEMALLNTTTYNNLTSISSTTGDSSAKQGVVRANVTWGNLVDLSDTSYGLTQIALQPASLNISNSDAAEGTTPIVSTDSFLNTPEYGKDGRVSEVKANTVTGVYQSNQFIVEQQEVKDGDKTTVAYADQSYGVRAVGVSSSLSPQELILNAARRAYTSSANSAATPTANAVHNNNKIFFALAMSLANESSTSYTTEQLNAMSTVAKGVQTSLNNIVKAYSNAILAKAATVDTISEDALAELQSQLTNNTIASAVSTLLGEVTGVNDYDNELQSLAKAQESVNGVITALASYTTSTDSATVKGTLETLVGTTADMTAYDKDGTSVTLKGDAATELMDSGVLYIGGGLLGTVAKHAGAYKMTSYAGATIYGGAKDEVGHLEEKVTGAVNGLTIQTNTGATSEGSQTATTTEKKTVISDLYGYIIDFAFRTNAADSFLQLQTEAANRVYSGDDSSDALQGGGSKVTFTPEAGMTEDMVKGLLENVKLVFLNPADGTVYAYAKLGTVTPDDEESPTNYTADITLDKQFVAQTGTEQNTTAIMSLTQNTATRVSVLVYLDGEKVENSDVLATAASSGTLDVNLQFSSSATLIPMSNTALKNLTITYDKMTLTDSKYTFDGVDYTVKSDYQLYTGSDGTVYYAKNVGNGETPTYVKLTYSNRLTALDAIDSSGSEAQTTYTVKFDLNGAKNGEGDATMEDVTQSEATYTLPESLDSGITAPDNKTFDGWSSEKNGTKINGKTITLTETTTTLYAVWKDPTID